MTPIDLFERQLPDGLADLAGARMPSYLDDILEATSRTRQRPRWTFFERWLPLSLITVAPRSAPLRATWTLLIVGLLTVALVVGLAFAGAQLLRDNDPTRLTGGLMVPALELDETWDATAIDGLSQPSGMDVGPDGNLYVVNAGANEILVLDPDGNIVRRWGELGAGEGQFYFQRDSQVPGSTYGGVAVAPDGTVYVADVTNDRVQAFDSSGRFVRQFGGYGPGDGMFLDPIDVAVDKGGGVYVVDDTRDDIQRFGPDGTYEKTIGSHGTEDGQMSNTGGIAVDPDGALYNADYANGRLQSWAPDGSYRWSIGRRPGDSVTLTLPDDVAVDDQGHVYVTEAGRIYVLTPDLRLASTLELPDDATPEQWFQIAIASDGTVYASSQTEGAIYKLRSLSQEIEVAAADEPAAEAPAPSGPAAIPATTAVPGSAEGTFTVGLPFAVPFTAYQPAGWVMGGTSTGAASMDLMRPGSDTYTQAVVQVFVPTNAYADPCLSEEPMSPPVGPTVDDLTAVLTDLPGILVTRPAVDIIIDGFSGKTFDLESTLMSGECPAGGVWAPMWTYDENGKETFAGPGDNFHQRIAILDVDGTRVLVEIWTFDDTPPTVVADAIRVFESIDFE